MNNPNEYGGLRFGRRPRLASPQVVGTAAGAILFTTAWLLLPASAMYWLTLIALVILIWTASYGWREALSQLLRWLHSLETL